ncbi:MAG: Trk system potassium transporter TrkA [Clostridia bacterium]|nr:Trk system potassium transporter TrkA [Clostridia bacterium]
MNIIVVGIGKVGYTVAEQLSQEMHDVTIIDTDEDVINDTLQDIDVIGVIGNGATSKTLTDAGISDCDLLIALTGSDELNILSCLLAKQLGAGSTIARVRNPEYSNDLRLIKDSLGLTIAVNPEREAAAEMQRILKFPTARNVDIFGHGKVDLLSFHINRSCNLCDKSVKDAFSRIKTKALICAVERGDDVFIPTGDFVIKEHDTIAVLTPEKTAPDFFKQIGFRTTHIKNIMIIGGGKIAVYLAKSLSHLNVNATIVEKDLDTALNLSYNLPNINVVHGDGTNRSLLLEEGMKKADAFCCLTGIDEENIVLSLFAKSVNPNIKTITKVNHTLFREVIKTLDIDSVVYPKFTTASIILKHVRSKTSRDGVSGVEKLTRIINNKVEAIEFQVSPESRLANCTVQDLTLRPNILLGSITRDGEVIIPRGSDTLMPGDSVVVVTSTERLTSLDDILTKD